MHGDARTGDARAGILLAQHRSPEVVANPRARQFLGFEMVRHGALTPGRRTSPICRWMPAPPRRAGFRKRHLARRRPRHLAPPAWPGRMPADLTERLGQVQVRRAQGGLLWTSLRAEKVEDGNSRSFLGCRRRDGRSASTRSGCRAAGPRPAAGVAGAAQQLVAGARAAGSPDRSSTTCGRLRIRGSSSLATARGGVVQRGVTAGASAETAARAVQACRKSARWALAESLPGPDRRRRPGAAPEQLLIRPNARAPSARGPMSTARWRSPTIAGRLPPAHRRPRWRQCVPGAIRRRTLVPAMLVAIDRPVALTRPHGRGAWTTSSRPWGCGRRARPRAAAPLTRHRPGHAAEAAAGPAATPFCCPVPGRGTSRAGIRVVALARRRLALGGASVNSACLPRWRSGRPCGPAGAKPRRASAARRMPVSEAVRNQRGDQPGTLRPLTVSLTARSRCDRP